jgi:hypothetical protein
VQDAKRDRLGIPGEPVAFEAPRSTPIGHGRPLLWENFAKKHQGLRVVFPKPLTSWLRGLDLNQRSLGYESEGNTNGPPAAVAPSLPSVTVT